MITQETLQALVDSWDDAEYSKMSEAVGPEDQERKKAGENYHRKLLEELYFLMEHYFSQYELNVPRLFIDVLLDWLGQFESNNCVLAGAGMPSALETEQRYAFVLARKVLFFNRNQIISLLSEVWGNIKKELLRLASDRLSLCLSELVFRTNSISDELDRSLFVPLSDSGHFMEFRHHCIPEGRSSMLIPCVDRLLLPVDLHAVDFIEGVKREYQHRPNLFIIEDFSGSGTSAKGKIKKIIDNYNFANIYFCPLIITDMAKESLGGLVGYAEKHDIRFGMLPGISLGEEYSIASADSERIWTSAEREALARISEKYFRSHFKDNAYLYSDHKNPEPSQATPLGFGNCGLPLVLYSNCPNNSLPILWADNNGWRPLFHRYERYVSIVKETGGPSDRKD